MENQIEEQEEQYIRTFPEPSQPEEGAKVVDLRHCAFTLEIQAVEINQKSFIYKEIYSKSEIVTLEKPKGKPNKKAKILFAMPIL